MLQGQLQAYAASVEDEEISELDGRGYARLVDYVETVSGADRQTIARFFAKGMLMNVLAAMQFSIADEPRDSWAGAWPRAAGSTRMKLFSFSWT